MAGEVAEVTHYEMENGEIVPAANDCGCITHNGPHWCHMDDWWRERNATFDQSTEAGLRAFISEEYRRLREKRHNMESLKIVRLIRDGQSD